MLQLHQRRSGLAMRCRLSGSGNAQGRQHLLHAAGRVWLHQCRYLVSIFFLTENQTKTKEYDMGTIPDGSEPSQPKRRQLELFADDSHHTRSTRRQAFDAKRKPLLELVLTTLRTLGRRGATAWELHQLLDVPYTSLNRPCLDLVRDHAIYRTCERRKTATGSPAAVMVHADFADSKVTA